MLASSKLADELFLRSPVLKNRKATGNAKIQGTICITNTLVQM
jgi:hypothetical protein